MKIEVYLPDNSYKNFSEEDVKLVLASALYDKGIVALGYAAESVGFTKRFLIENMGKFDVSVLKIDKNEFKKGLENSKKRAESKENKEKP
jgi:hypothetical protein